MESSLMDNRRVTRSLVDHTLERLEALDPLEPEVLELHSRDINLWLEELKLIDKEIIRVARPEEVSDLVDDVFTYKTGVHLSLKGMKDSLHSTESTPPLTSTPQPTLPNPSQVGYELAKPKISCPTFDGLDRDNKFALRDFLEKFKFCTSGLHTNKERLICLKTYVSGRPFHLIHHLSENEWNYNIAIDILKAEYWDRNAIREEIFEKIIQGQPKVDKNYEHLKEYLAQLRYELRELDSDYGYDFLVEGSGSGALVAHILFEKIPCEVRAELIRGSNTPYPNLDCILHYTSDVIKALLRVRPESTCRTNTSRFRPGTNSSWSGNDMRRTTEGFHIDLDLENPYFCNFCGRNGHSSVSCKTYPSYGERIKRCKQLSLCQSCSDASHHSRACPKGKGSRARCTYCHAHGHLSVLCPELKPEESGINVSVNTNAGTTHNILPMFRTTIRRGSYSVSLTCLLDSGSQRSYFSREVLNHLHCDPDSLEDVALDVVSFVGRRHRRFKQLRAVVDLFPGAAPEIPILIDSQLDLSHKVPGLPLVWKNLRDLGLDLATDITSGSVRLWGLIGVDLLQHMYPIKVVKCMHGTAWETPSGIVPFGDIRHFLFDDQVKPLTECSKNRSYDRIVKRFPCRNSLVNNAMNPCHSYADPFADVFEDSRVDRGLEWMFSLESLGLPESEGDPNYDKMKLKEFMDNISLTNGRYLIKLPWYEDRLKRVQSNHHVAIKVLDRVVCDLEKKGLYEEYLRVFEDQEQEGIIEPLECSPSEYKNYVWIPHRPVLKTDPTSTTKIRPVFNCSFKIGKSYSLNDAAYAGINLTGDMLDLTLHFRMNGYVFLADIRKAFLMVRLADDADKNRFCFFLKKNNQLKCFRYVTIIFGFSASPFILNCILKFHAGLFPRDPCTKMLMSNFYVDNLIRTDNSLENLTSLYSKAVERLQEGGFMLQSCNSNSTTLRETMKKDGTYIKHDCSYERVLGYRYHPQKDVINVAPYDCDPSARTKRRILSEASKIFDPLSLCLPVTIQARTFISELWKLGLHWDEDVPEEMLARWKVIAQELSGVSSIELPRRTIDEGGEANMFLFCDASKKAYGFAAYVAKGGASSLIFAKAKVAPLKPKTLPTMELLAAFLAIKCLPTLLRTFSKVCFKNIFVAVDAQIVLSWLISRTTNGRNVFAKNRLEDIVRWETELTTEFGVHLHYKYVPSDQNPADYITRGLSVSKLKNNLSYWIGGPHWISNRSVVWPENALNCLSSEGKRIVTTVCCTLPRHQVEPVVSFDRFSTLSTLINVTARVIEFVNKLRKRDSDPVRTARLHLIGVMQRQSFWEELAYLQNPVGRPIPVRVQALALFLDEKGIIRSRGKIGKSTVYEFEIHNPVILAKDHQLTRLIIRDCHLQCGHLSIPTTLNKVRLSGFWIPQGRQAVKKTLSDCSLCQRFNAIPFSLPKRTDLPKHRVNLIRPFLRTGVDFTGHLWVSQAQERVKMYVLVFTCLEVRAVHLELVKDMSVHSFLTAFVRFTNTYGIPSHIYSDNAKSFVAGCNVVHEVFTSSAYKERFGTCEIEHVKIPLYSPWCGGAWERLIRTIKTCLYKLIGRASYTYFDLLTTLSDVQTAINDRPLIYRSSSDQGLEIITPNHFLHPVINPRLILRINKKDISQIEPPSRMHLLESLSYRDESLKRFKRIWYEEYLLSLRERAQSQSGGTSNSVSEGELVIIKTPNRSRPFWALGRVTHLYPGEDGLIRSVQVKREDGSLQVHSLRNLYPLESKDERIRPMQDNSDDEYISPTITYDNPVEAEFIENCPVCSLPDDGNPMICCDRCDEWFHFACVGLRQSPPMAENWYCPNCLNWNFVMEDLPSSQPDVPCVEPSEGDERIWICPGCGLPDDGTAMISCDGCQAWYHFRCVGIQHPPPEQEAWYCYQCL